MADPRVGHWTEIGPVPISAGGGPATGVLFSLVIAPGDHRRIYVASPTSGVWVTADAGTTWRSASAGLGSLAVAALAVDAALPKHVFAAIPGKGILESVNGGAGWTISGSPPGALPAVTDLLIDPTNAQVLHVRTQSGIYRSADSGVTWKLSKSGPTTSLVMAPGSPDTLYAGVPAAGVARTSNGGSTGDAGWSVLTPGVPADVFDVHVDISVADPRTIYARYRRGSGNEIQQSTDGGATWRLKSTPQFYIALIAADDSRANSAYVAGVDFYRSDDGGATWTAKSGAHVDHHAVASDPTDRKVVYTACDGGLYRSNRGESWAFVAGGIANVEFYDLAISPTRPELAIGGTQDNGTVLTDGSSLAWKGILGGDGATVAIDPTNARVLYAMNQYASSIAQSTDGGAHFHNIAAGLPTGSACFNLHFQVHPGGRKLLASCGSLWRTDLPTPDWSAIFTPPGAPAEVAVRSAVAAGSDTYYSGTNQGSIYCGVGGAGWQLAFTHPDGAAVVDLVVDPDDPSILYAAFGGGSKQVYRLSQSGAGLVSPAVNDDFSLGMLRRLGGAPGPAAAADITDDLPAGVAARTLVVDAMRPFTVYLGTASGVYRGLSRDRGTSWRWTGYNAGLPPADVRALRVHPTTGLIRAATFGRGAFQVFTDWPVGTIVTATGRLTFLRVHDVGTGYGRAPNVLDAEVIVLLDSQPGLAFGFQLRADDQEAARTEMVELLRSAFRAHRPVAFDYRRTAPRAGQIIRVWLAS